MPYKNPEDAKAHKKKYYHENKESIKAKRALPENMVAARIRDKKRRQSRKQLAVDKLGGKCFDCKQEYPLPCYDFHHENPEEKDFDPCIGLTKSLAKFLAEVEKCVLLCANCHRIRHFEASVS